MATHQRQRWLPWTAMAAVLLGAAATIVLLPNADRAQALRGIASADAEMRVQAWAWFSTNAPAATRPRVIIMLDGHPDALHATLTLASAQARRDAAVALVSISGFQPSMVSRSTWMPMLQALRAGSPDEHSLADAVEASTLHDRRGNVTMPHTHNQ